MGNDNKRVRCISFPTFVIAGIAVRRLQSARRLREQETPRERRSCKLHGAMDAAEPDRRERELHSI